jgi:RNA polymerase sigma factor (TIGR02999 family)
VDDPLSDPRFEDIYLDLKRRARALRSGQNSHTLDTTALVHESFLKLAEAEAGASASAKDRAHLFRLAALAMRQVLIDHLRERQANKRGGDLQRVDLTDIELPVEDPAQGLTEVLQALERLQALDARLADVFALRAFAGLGFEDIGGLLERSRSAVQRDFETARAYLLSTLD